jgi:hypothetical protein
VVPMITSMTKHFMFHIRWNSILKFLYPMGLLHLSVSKFYFSCF